MRCDDDAPPWTCKSVTFRGQDFVFLEMLDGSGGMLAEPVQLDERNHVRLDEFYGEPFAHVTPDGLIRRYGQTIGTVAGFIAP
jgi:hypothetical protein